MLLDEEFAERVDGVGCGSYDKQYLDHSHVEDTACKALLVASE